MNLLERVKEKCIEDGDCWIWQGMWISHAPRMWSEDKYVAVRELLMRELGRLRLNAKFFGTTCGDSRCVCPDHVAQRTKSEHLSFRGKLGASGASLQIRSARCATTQRAAVGKITLEEARNIRMSDKTIRELAEEHGIAKETVRRIRVGRTWKETSNHFAGLMR